VGRAEYRSLECNADGQRYILQDWGVFLYTPADPDAQIDATVTIWSLGTRGVAYNEPTSISQGNADTIPVMLMSQEFDNGGHPCIFPIDGDPDVDVDLLPNPDNNRGVWKANAINTLRQVVGNASIGGFVNPVRYFPGIDPKPVSLGFLPKPGRTPWGWALDINETGSVTGCSTTSNGGAVHAFRYNTSTGMKDLGGLGTSSTYGYGINKNGDVVGDATTSRRAFLYTDTYGMVDLKQTIVNLPAELAQVTMTAKKINDSGWIVGSFGVVERGQVYLLTPVE
jgi:probable HAF family extracellular repeat protein